MTAALLLAGLMIASTPTLACATAATVSFGFDQNTADASFRVRAGAVRVRGTFGSWRGSLDAVTRGDGLCLDVELDAASVTMGSDTTTDFARGDGFFDAARHPTLSLRSESFPRVVLTEGGTLNAVLTLRGVPRETPVQFTALECGKRSRAKCVLRLRASIQRSDFGMRGMRGIVGDAIDLELDIRGSARQFGAAPLASR